MKTYIYIPQFLQSSLEKIRANREEIAVAFRLNQKAFAAVDFNYSLKLLQVAVYKMLTYE